MHILSEFMKFVPVPSRPPSPLPTLVLRFFSILFKQHIFTFTHLHFQTTPLYVHSSSYTPPFYYLKSQVVGREFKTEVVYNQHSVEEIGVRELNKIRITRFHISHLCVLCKFLTFIISHLVQIPL